MTCFECIHKEICMHFISGVVPNKCNDYLNLVEALEKNERKFEEIVVEYPPAELCTYPEYRGKPYFSIKYEENGTHIIGFGTYKPEVLSRYLLEYFITTPTKRSEEL